MSQVPLHGLCQLLICLLLLLLDPGVGDGISPGERKEGALESSLVPPNSQATAQAGSVDRDSWDFWFPGR